MDILMQIFELCVVPLLGILTTFLVKYINQKSQEIQTKTSSELLSKYVGLLDKTITNTVIAVNQTYVEALKDKNAFDKSAQTIALQTALKNIKASLPAEALSYLNEIYGDLDVYLRTKIEAEVNKNKKKEEL